MSDLMFSEIWNIQHGYSKWRVKLVFFFCTSNQFVSSPGKLINQFERFRKHNMKSPSSSDRLITEWIMRENQMQIASLDRFALLAYTYISRKRDASESHVHTYTYVIHIIINAHQFNFYTNSWNLQMERRWNFPRAEKLFPVCERKRKIILKNRSSSA